MPISGVRVASGSWPRIPAFCGETVVKKRSCCGGGSLSAASPLLAIQRWRRRSFSSPLARLAGRSAGRMIVSTSFMPIVKGGGGGFTSAGRLSRCARIATSVAPASHSRFRPVPSLCVVQGQGYDAG